MAERGRRGFAGAIGASALVSTLPAAPARAQASGEPIRLAVIEGFSGPFANAGDSVWRNLLFAVDRVNARGGVHRRQATAAAA